MADHRSFRRLALFTVIAVYFLILVGGIVRAAGAGMGCPDWPQCFGRWVPPTDESQLPENYRELYAEHGYADAGFNAFKTWTEYVNRLIGVVIGFLVLATLIASRRYWNRDRAVTGWAACAFVLVGFQGWLGSVVVSTNLATWMVTIHMLVALVIVGILIYALVRSQRDVVPPHTIVPSRALEIGLPVVLLSSLVQVVMGTQVREEIDMVATRLPERADWAGELGALLVAHRTFSLVVLVLNIWLVLRLRRARRRRVEWMGPLVGCLIATVVLEIAAGTGLYLLGMPALLQPVHLLLASVLVGLQFAIWVLYRYSSRTASDQREVSGSVASPLPAA